MFLPSRRRHGRSAFTLIEMLIAMAVTLLMMAALGRMFQSIGRGMQDSRANVEMSAKLRSVTFRLKEELSLATANMQPPLASGDGSGYFVYHDGPMTDATTMMLTGGIALVDDQVIDYRSTSKFGDFDDYIAFTAVAPGSEYFTGVVPYGVVSGAYPGRYPAGAMAASALVPIESKYAEIIYWVQPVMEAGVVVDRNSDGLPDLMNLHRRVLLIRPDLNNAAGLLPVVGTVPGTSPSPVNTMMVMRRYDGSTIASTGAPQYYYGETYPGNYDQQLEIYQDCDLSIRRPLQANGLPAAGGQVAANSLSDLAMPHNRFAHVRIPGGTGVMSSIGTATTMTSMPILDLAGPASIPYLTNNAALLSGRTTIETTSGFLSAAYSLRGSRAGEDVVLSNLTAFDVKIFDPEAPVLIHSGPDGIPGYSNTAASYGELGSDDVVLTPSDPGFFTAIRGTSPAASGAFSATSPWSFVLGSNGAFVDLDYVYKAAGTVQASSGAGTANLNAYCDSHFSNYDTSRPGSGWRFPDSLGKSGAYVQRSGGLTFYQPRFDTWAQNYEFDGFNQEVSPTGEGTIWSTNSTMANTDTGNDGLDVGGGIGIDDEGERETSAPYVSPMRAIQIKIRIEDQSTRLLRELMVTQEYVN
ncbi:hypothetical protein FF011L_21760 [Roseimaritima multifibrata]|uniref:Prepilin-type N-terminal cleavage/methylation domain-containing protein n=1 Tax=Roseimaritima multifibrata TaxID=1930274 RepID=A0A517MEX5_9BACT|nr:prepilin-type N-terminal cleavage/methylation domain-containing protein [Roseimaritima multifibrata]QDS93406.1 hypothetical protein FF011L_21760 [Roseimaritima multifibrata]